MKPLILNNWAANPASLVLASVLWLLIRRSLEETAAPDDGSQPTFIVPGAGGGIRGWRERERGERIWLPRNLPYTLDEDDPCQRNHHSRNRRPSRRG